MPFTTAKSPAATAPAIRPFTIETPEVDLEDLRARIAATRWPEKEPVTDHSQGVPLETMEKLARYCQHSRLTPLSKQAVRSALRATLRPRVASVPPYRLTALPPYRPTALPPYRLTSRAIYSHGAAMAIEETPGNSGREIETTESSRHPSGFAAGLVLGVLIGAAFALLVAPEQGEKTRGRLRKRMRSLGEGAREGIERAGARTRKELRRRQRRFQAELERARERAEDALD